MKKLMLIFVLLMLMPGCSAAETFETLGSVQHVQQTLPEMATVALSLPESAVAQTFGGVNTMYECDGYTLLLQTLSSGDLISTVQTISGFSPNQLTVIKTGDDEVKRYDWVWTATGEEGDVICRASVLDDGNYHYCLSALAPANQGAALKEEWTQLFSSFGVRQ